MVKNLSIGEIHSSFLSCEKDTESILRKIFVESQPYSDDLKRLMVIQTKDCLDNRTSDIYKKRVSEMSLKKLIDEQYIILDPQIKLEENEEIKSYIILSFDNFTPNGTNPEFRDCIIYIDVLCHPDYWDIGNFRQRPLKICGIIDGILNKTRLSGIGVLNFLGANKISLHNDLCGYTLMYSAIHGSDDKLEPKEED